jgi:hypothetical protein
MPNSILDFKGLPKNPKNYLSSTEKLRGNGKSMIPPLKLVQTLKRSKVINSLFQITLMITLLTCQLFQIITRNMIMITSHQLTFIL